MKPKIKTPTIEEIAKTALTIQQNPPSVGVITEIAKKVKEHYDQFDFVDEVTSPDQRFLNK